MRCLFRQAIRGALPEALDIEADAATPLRRALIEVDADPPETRALQRAGVRG
jgi:hypothetical protein